MKVGLVCPYDWSHPGGVRTHILGLARALTDNGIEHQIIAPSSKAEAGVFDVGNTVGIPQNGSVARICFSVSAKSRIQERLAVGDLDLLHLHEPLIPSVSLLALSQRKKAPCVATFHAAAQRSLGYAIAKPVLGRYMNQLRTRIAVSEAALQFISHYFPNGYRVIPNGIDGGRFHGAAPDPQLVGAKPFVLFVGRPEPRKGFEVLLEAMRRVRQSHDVRLVTVGGEPAAKEEWLIPAGVVDDTRLPGIYAAADIFCAPSRRGESFGIVLLEAMAAGTPVVASDIPGYREAAGNTAVLVPPGDPKALAGEMQRLLEDPGAASALAAQGRDRAASLDWRVLATEVIEIYEQALNAKKPPV